MTLFAKIMRKLAKEGKVKMTEKKQGKKQYVFELVKVTAMPKYSDEYIINCETPKKASVYGGYFHS